MNKRIETLDDVRKYLASIRHINLGGCGIAALAMYRWLIKENRRERVAFVFCYGDPGGDDGGWTFYRNTRALTGGRVKPVGCAHIGIMLEKNRDSYAIDCSSNINLLKYGNIHTTRSVDFLLKALNNVNTWHEAFTRENISRIEKRLKIDLSDVKKKQPINW